MFNRIRTAHYKKMFGSFGEKSRILGNVKLYFPENINFGSRSTLNEGVLLNATNKIFIGNDVHISPHVIINTGYLDYQKKGTARKHISKPVTICDGVWVGSGATINPGVTIGQNSVVGAGAVVTRNIEENHVVVGVPARTIKEI